jgi:hypothetical protein
MRKGRIVVGLMMKCGKSREQVDVFDIRED